MRLLRLSAAISIVLVGGCAYATQTYSLILHPLSAFSGSSVAASSVAGSSSAASAVSSTIGPGASGLLPDASAASHAPTTLGTFGSDDGTANTVGSLSVERIEGGQRLVVLQLNQLPPPERIAPGLHAFVVWLEDPRGRKVKVGTLHYDRAHHSGNLLATTELSAFTVRVTGERDALTSEPSGVLLAERRVVAN